MSKKDAKQPKIRPKLTKNNPKGDLNWPKTSQNKQKASQHNPKSDINWPKTS